MAQDNTVLMEGVKLVLRNFSGKRESPYNKPGDRNFAVLLDPAVAEQMLADDWNVKFFKKREDDDPEEPPQAFLPIAAEFRKGSPPRVVVMTEEGGRRHLGEDDIDTLDSAHIVNVDLIVNPRPWDVNGKSGVKAYLRTMYVLIEEDALQKKYDHDLESTPEPEE